MSYQNSRNGSMSGQQSYMTGPPTSAPHTTTSSNGSQYTQEFRGQQYAQTYPNQDYSSDVPAPNVAVGHASHGQPLTLNQLLLQNNSLGPQPSRISGAASPMNQPSGYRYDPYGYMPKSGQPLQRSDGDHMTMKDPNMPDRTSRSNTPQEGSTDQGPTEGPSKSQNRPSGGPSPMPGAYATGVPPHQIEARMGPGMMRPGGPPMPPMGGAGGYPPRPGIPPGGGYQQDPYTGYPPQRYSQPQRYPTPGGYSMMPPPPPPNGGSGYPEYQKMSPYMMPPDYPNYGGPRAPYPDMYGGGRVPGGYPQPMANGVGPSASPRCPPSRYHPQEGGPPMTPQQQQVDQTPFSPSQQQQPHSQPNRAESRDGSVSSRMSGSGETGQQPQPPPPQDAAVRPPSRPQSSSPYPPTSGLHQRPPTMEPHQQQQLQPMPSPKKDSSEDAHQQTSASAAQTPQGLAQPPPPQQQQQHVPTVASPHHQHPHAQQYGMMQQQQPHQQPPPPHPMYRQSPPIGAPSGLRMPMRGPPGAPGSGYLPGGGGYFQHQAQYSYGEIPPGYHPQQQQQPYGQFSHAPPAAPPHPPPAYQRGYQQQHQQQQMHAAMLLPPNNLNPQSASCFSRLMEMGYEPERRRWLEHYFCFMEEIGKPLTGLPQVVKQPLDLYRFYLAVRERGGVMEIIKSKRWKEISQLVNVNASASAAYTLRKNYCKYLLDYECRFDHGPGGGADVRSIAAQIESLSGKKKKSSVGSMGGGSSEMNESSTSSSTPFPPPSPVGSQSSASSNLVMPAAGNGGATVPPPATSPVNTTLTSTGGGGGGGVTSPALSSSAANSPYPAPPPPLTSTSPPSACQGMEQAVTPTTNNWRPSLQQSRPPTGPADVPAAVTYPPRMPGPGYGETPSRQGPYPTHPAPYGRGPPLPPPSASIANHPMVAMEGMRPGSPGCGPQLEVPTPPPPPSQQQQQQHPPPALPHGPPVSRPPTGNTVHHPPSLYPPPQQQGGGYPGGPAPPPPSFTAHYQPPPPPPSTRPPVSQPQAPPPPPQYHQQQQRPYGYLQRPPPPSPQQQQQQQQRHQGMVMGGPQQQQMHPGMMQQQQMPMHHQHQQVPPPPQQQQLQHHHQLQAMTQQQQQQMQRPMVVGNGATGAAVAAYWRRMEAVTIQHFPPGCVESTPIDASRRKRHRIKDLGQLNGSKLMMAMRCGLPSETTWALNALNIILREDPGVLESLFANPSPHHSTTTALSMTGLVTALTNHLRHAANELFPQHHLACDLELPALLNSNNSTNQDSSHPSSSSPPPLDLQTPQKPPAHLFIDLLAEVSSKRGQGTQRGSPNGIVGLEREITRLADAKGVSVGAFREATRQLLRGGKNGMVSLHSRIPQKTASAEAAGLERSTSANSLASKRARGVVGGRASSTSLVSAANGEHAALTSVTNPQQQQPSAKSVNPLVVVNNLNGAEACSNVRRLALFALDELLEGKKHPPPVLLSAASELTSSLPSSPHTPPPSMGELFQRGGSDSTCFILPHPGSYSNGSIRASKRTINASSTISDTTGSAAAKSSPSGIKRARSSSSSSSSLPVLSPQKVEEEEKENTECPGKVEEQVDAESGEEDSELKSHRLMADSRGYCPLRARFEIIRIGDLALWPVDGPSEESEGYALRCLGASTVLRNLSFMPSAERVLSQHRALLALAARLLSIAHYHVDLTEDSSGALGDWACVEDHLTRFYSKSAWWMPWREELCENILVLLVNISGHLECLSLHESIARPLLEGLLHWATCQTAAATDPLPGHRVISPSRLALEALNRLSVSGSNVAMILATAQQNGSTDGKLFDRLVSWLALPEDQVTRELALSTIHYLTEPPGNIFQPQAPSSENASSDNNTNTSSFGLSMLAQAKPCPIAGLISFVEIAESKTQRVLAQYGLHALQEQPDLMGTSLELVRRAGALLERLAANPLARNHFTPELELRLLSLATSRVLDATVAQLLSGCLYNLPQQDTSTTISGLIPELPSFSRVANILAPLMKREPEEKEEAVEETKSDEKHDSLEEEKTMKRNTVSPQHTSPELVAAV